MECFRLANANVYLYSIIDGAVLDSDISRVNYTHLREITVVNLLPSKCKIAVDAFPSWK